MAKNSIRDFDNTSGNNTDIQSVDISEGCSPAGINNAIREMMADLADVNDGTVALTSPSADSMTVTGDLTVDTNTLHVDSTNNRVGVGTSSPSKDLHLGTLKELRLQTGSTTYDFTPTAGGTDQLVINSSLATFYDFKMAGTTKASITTNGITFNGDTAAANALDDYEEGTWTPTYSGSTTNPTVSYTEQHGEYVKIGRQVIARLELKTSSFSGGSGTVTVGGLPFTTTSNDGARSGNLIVGYSQGFASATHAPQTGYASQSSTSIILGHRASDTGANAELSGTFTMSNWSSSGNNFLMATLIYTAA